MKASKETLIRREASKARKLREKQGFFGIGKQDSEVQGILLEGESRRLDIVTDPAFWTPIDTINLDTSQAGKILDLYRWEMDRLGIGLLQAVDRRVWKIKNGGHTKGPKALAKGPKRREVQGIGKPMVPRPEAKPGKPSEKGKHRYKPSRKGKGSAFDKIDPIEARSASLLWLVDTLDGKQAGLYAQARGKTAWLPSLSTELQRARLEVCRFAYLVQDDGINPLPIGKLRNVLDEIPQADKSKAWGYSTVQHTCLNCGHKHYRKPDQCEKCGNGNFRSEPVGPAASLLKAVAQAVGKALSLGRLRFPGEKQDMLCPLSLDGLTKEADDTDGKPNRWEPVQRVLYSHIEARSMVRLAIQEAQADPRAARLVPIIVGKLRKHTEDLILRNIRRKLRDRQALKAGTDPGRLRDLGIDPPKYSRRTFYYDLAEVRRIGKLCRKALEAEAVQEAEAYLDGEALQAEVKACLGFQADPVQVDPTGSRQAKAVQEALEYCRYWAQHAFDRRKLSDPDYPTDRLPDPEAYLDARAVVWSEANHWLTVQEADKPKPTDRQTKADRQAEVAKRQAYRYCQWWAQHAFDRRQVQDQPEAYLDFNAYTWDQSKAWLRKIGKPEAVA